MDTFRDAPSAFGMRGRGAGRMLGSMKRAPVIVHPPCSGGRRVTLYGQDLGRALRPGDVAAILRRAGFCTTKFVWDDTGVFEWRDGGPDVWLMP